MNELIMRFSIGLAEAEGTDIGVNMPMIALFVFLMLSTFVLAEQTSDRRSGPTNAGFFSIFYLVAFAALTRLNLTQGYAALTGCILVLCGIVLLVWGLRRRSRWMLFAALGLVGLPLAFWSGGSGSAGGWASWFQQFGLTYEQADQIVFWLRKVIHFSYYGLIAYTAVRTAILSQAKQPLIFGALWFLGHAVFDESRQLSLASRTGSVRDLAIDCIGAVICTAPFWLPKKKAEVQE